MNKTLIALAVSAAAVATGANAAEIYNFNTDQTVTLSKWVVVLKHVYLLKMAKQKTTLAYV